MYYIPWEDNLFWMWFWHVIQIWSVKTATRSSWTQRSQHGTILIAPHWLLSGLHGTLTLLLRWSRNYQLSNLKHFFSLTTQAEQDGINGNLKRHCNTDLRQNFFSERVINMYNSLDKDTVAATSTKCFKGRLQKMRRKDESAVGLPFDQSTLAAEPVPRLGHIQ